MSDKAFAAAISGTITGRLVNRTRLNLLDSCSDEAIIDLVCEGNTEVFGALVKMYEDFIFTLARGLGHSGDTAKDIAQEVFLRAYRALRRFEKRSSFKTWLYRIAYNTSMSHLKRLGEISNADSRPVCISESFDGLPMKSTLRKLVGLLKPELKAVVIFHYYDDLKYEEIAEIMNCPVGTVKVRLFRARHDLKNLWERYAIQL